MLGEHQAALADEISEQAQFGRGQLELPARPARQAGLLVDDDIAGFDRRAEAACPSQYGTDASEQLFEREGLDQVVVGAELEAVQPVLDRIARGQEDDRQITGGAQLPSQREPVATREQHIEHGKVGGGGEDQVWPRVVGEAGDADPFPSQRPLDRLSDWLLVLDQHHPWRVCAHGDEVSPPS